MENSINTTMADNNEILFRTITDHYSQKISDMVPWILAGFLISNVIQWSPAIIMVGLTAFWLYRKTVVERERSIVEVRENMSHYQHLAKSFYNFTMNLLQKPPADKTE